MSGDYLVKLPEYLEDEKKSDLTGARSEHIEVLYRAGIYRYDQLRKFGDPESLIIRIAPVADNCSISVDIFDSDLVDEWLKQAYNEHPGTVITQPKL